MRRWPWTQVRELGFTVEKGQALVPTARIDGGPADGVEASGWITLARPLAGPFTQHRNAQRLRALAERRGLPYTEGLTAADLADTWLGRLRSPRR